MKVISGKYKGKNIDGYNIDGTRPTQDRVKESMFAMIQDYLSDSVVLDLFAGSGNLGIEALSNGASMVYFVDSNDKCVRIINKNLTGIGDGYQIKCMDYRDSLLFFEKSKITFDVILLDPPYKLNCISEILLTVIKKSLLNSSGIIVCEYENDDFLDDYPELELIKYKKYGYKNVRIYRRR